MNVHRTIRTTATGTVRRTCRTSVRISAMAVGLAAAIASAPAGFAGDTAVGASQHRAPVPSAVIQWNDTASSVLGVDSALPAPVMAVGMAYVQAAVYNAVTGMEGGGPLYKWNVRSTCAGSTDAAVAAAARRVLNAYFTLGTARADAAYTAALAAIPEGPAKECGIAYGELAAQHLLSQRAGDGWKAPVQFLQPLAPGVWRPTPPAEAAYLAPWLGMMVPFTLTSAAQFRPGSPPPLGSARYAQDLREVEDLGSATSTTRTAEQTEIARFFGGNLTVQLQAAYRDHATRYGMSNRRSARYLAVADLAAADAVIGAWDAKYFYGFWRPVTAIRLADTDGNPQTTADPTWTPLLVTPPFPDYLSGHTTVIGAITSALASLDDTDRVDLNLNSSVTGTTRHYEMGATLNQEGIGARIRGGIHFRTADEVGSAVGSKIGAWSASHLG